MHRCTPEVIEKNVGEWCVGPEIPVVFDSTYIVENETAVATVVIANDAREHHHGPQSMFQSHLVALTRRHSHSRKNPNEFTCAFTAALTRRAFLIYSDNIGIEAAFQRCLI